MSITEVEAMLATVDFGREITHIQIHHTWKPTLAQYSSSADKEGIILGMYNYHVDVKGMSDIAQHFTVVPAGLWSGRPLTKSPGGFRITPTGDPNKGGICLEFLGNFDQGEEVLTGPQLENGIRLIRAIIKRFPKVAIIFHREKDATKSCPGTGISKDWFLAQLNDPVEQALVWALADGGITNRSLWDQYLKGQRFISPSHVRQMIINYHKALERAKEE